MQVKKIVKWFLVLVFVTLCIGIYAWREYHRPPKSTSDLKVRFEKTASQIVQEFEKNETTSNALYNDKVMAIRGKLVQLNITDTTQQIMLAGPVSSGGVICDLELNQRNQLTSLKIGTEITVVGVCTGFLMDVVMVRCIVKVK